MTELTALTTGTPDSVPAASPTIDIDPIASWV
jgi:hypothetical protein